MACINIHNHISFGQHARMYTKHTFLIHFKSNIYKIVFYWTMRDRAMEESCMSGEGSDHMGLVPKGRSMMLEDYLQLADDLQKACNTMTSVPGSLKLKRLIHTEAEFLRTLGKKKKVEQAAQLASSNLNHYAAILHAAAYLPGVTRLLQPVSCSNQFCSNSSHLVSGTKMLLVDVVAAEGNAWVKVVARKSKALHQAWLGQGQSGEQDVVQQAQEYLACAACHPVNFKPPSFHMAFYGGITQPLSNALAHHGVIVWGGIVDVDKVLQRLSNLHCFDLASSSKAKDDLECDRVLCDDDLECDGDDSVDNSGGWRENEQTREVFFSKFQGRRGSDGSGGTKAPKSSLNALDHEECWPGYQNTCDDTCDVDVVFGKSSADTNTPAVLEKKLFDCSIFSTQDKLCNDDVQKPLFVCDSGKQARFIIEESLLSLLLVCQPDYASFNSKTNVKDKTQQQVATVNLDITTLICLISSVCNGNCHLRFTDPILDQQATEERVSPVLPSLQKFLQGKALVVCQTALKGFKDIVAVTAGPKERERAENLLNFVTIVDDQPSPRASSLKSQGRVKERSKVIFGTGDTLHAVTVTANSGFIRAAECQGVSFTVHVHQARALTEQKEADAKPL